MQIDRIKKLTIGVFRDFNWPKKLKNFNRYNLIYGWNGSGKTTISRVFRALEMRTAPDGGKVTLTINKNDISDKNFEKSTLPVRVFNRDFIAKSVFPVEEDDKMPPIFVVGEENVEKQKEIERIKKLRYEVQGKLKSKESERNKAEKAFDKHCIDSAKLIKYTLLSPSAKYYNNYYKSTFEKRANEMLEDPDPRSYRLDNSEHNTLLKKCSATQKLELLPLKYQLPALEALANTVSKLLSKTVVSKAIQKLKDDPALSEWVQQGMGLHQDRSVENCLFCEQSLPGARLGALEAHFNAKHEQFQGQLDAKISQISDAVKESEGLERKLPNKAEFYGDLAEEYDGAALALCETNTSTKKYLEGLAQELNKKKANPFEKLVLEALPPMENGTAISRLNKVIQNHNEATKNFEKETSTARQRLEAGIVFNRLKDFRELKTAKGKLENDIHTAKDEEKCLTEEISKFESEIIDRRRSVKELNEDLHRYLGHSELYLEEANTGYKVSRNGDTAESLSEGEMTAIALLYFLKTLKDKEFNLEKGIVVLDDPVSSLDANALYFAYSFIRERTKDAAQLFILTHNFTFFREVRKWFRQRNYREEKKNPGQRLAHFYMLECSNDQDPRCSTLCELDPLLEKFESEYHYLFHRIYRFAETSKPEGLENNYVIPNMARRLLETFLAFRQPTESGTPLWQQMQKANKFDKKRMMRILRFLNVHSHSDAIGAPEHDLSLLSETGSVIGDLLDFIREQDKEHYLEMKKLVEQSAEKEDET